MRSDLLKKHSLPILNADVRANAALCCPGESSCSLGRIHGHNFFNPVGVFTHLGVNCGVSWILAAMIEPRQTLQFTGTLHHIAATSLKKTQHNALLKLKVMWWKTALESVGWTGSETISISISASCWCSPGSYLCLLDRRRPWHPRTDMKGRYSNKSCHPQQAQ